MKPTRKIFSRNSDIIWGLLFILSLVLIIIGIGIYRNTVISFMHLFGIVGLGTILFIAILFFILKINCSLLVTFLASIIIGGGTLFFSILYINKQFAYKEVLIENFTIKKKGNFSRGRKGNCSQPYVYIDFYGLEKQLVFYCQEQEKVDNSSKVILAYSTGFFGFEVIHNKELVEN